MPLPTIKRLYGRAKLLCVKPIHRRNPFWVVGAKGDVIHAHGGICNDVFIDFLLRLILEVDSIWAGRSPATEPGR